MEINYIKKMEKKNLTHMHGRILMLRDRFDRCTIESIFIFAEGLSACAGYR